jgi:hypothetical protein
MEALDPVFSFLKHCIQAVVDVLLFVAIAFIVRHRCCAVTAGDYDQVFFDTVPVHKVTCW